jgi:hypothetical protein
VDCPFQAPGRGMPDYSKFLLKTRIIICFSTLSRITC